MLGIEKCFSGKSTLYDRWSKINDDINEIMGVDVEYMAYLHHRKMAVIYRTEAILNNEKFKLTLASVEEKNAELYKPTGKGRTLHQNLVILSKNQGYRNDSNINVLEYYSLIKEYSKSGKAS